MFGSEVLEVVIGLLFIYLLLSLLATVINEIITTTFSARRGKILQKAIRTMLSDHFDPKKDLKSQAKPDDQELTEDELPVKNEDLGLAFYEHPLVYRFAKKGKMGLPSYLTKKNFSLVVIDLLGDQNSAERSLESIKKTVERLPEGGTRTVFLTLIANAQGDINKFKALLENWFDEMMDRASGWYKRHVQKILIIIGFVLSVAFNADTFQIASTLSSDPEKRAQLVNMAESYVEKNVTTDTATAARDSLRNPNFIAKMCRENKTDRAFWCRMDSLNQQVDYLVQDELKQARGVLGLGWRLPDFDVADMKGESGIERFGQYISKTTTLFYSQLAISQFFGWIVTAFAISLGAPFWFDLLNKIMKMRGTGSKPEENPKSIPKSEPVG